MVDNISALGSLYSEKQNWSEENKQYIFLKNVCTLLIYYIYILHKTSKTRFFWGGTHDTFLTLQQKCS